MSRFLCPNRTCHKSQLGLSLSDSCTVIWNRKKDSLDIQSMPFPFPVFKTVRINLNSICLVSSVRHCVTAAQNKQIITHPECQSSTQDFLNLSPFCSLLFPSTDSILVPGWSEHCSESLYHPLAGVPASGLVPSGTFST